MQFSHVCQVAGSWRLKQNRQHLLKVVSVTLLSSCSTVGGGWTMFLWPQTEMMHLREAENDANQFPKREAELVLTLAIWGKKPPWLYMSMSTL